MKTIRFIQKNRLKLTPKKFETVKLLAYYSARARLYNRPLNVSILMMKRLNTKVRESKEEYLKLQRDGVNTDVNGSANILIKFLTSNGQQQHPVVANRYRCLNHPKRLKLRDIISQHITYLQAKPHPSGLGC